MILHFWTLRLPCTEDSEATWRFGAMNPCYAVFSVLKPGPAAFRTEEAVDRSWQRCPILYKKAIAVSHAAEPMGL